ncbi:MAG: Rieske 2Fe-2S domain-containing protein [Acidimicrobiia bacterium]|nr:Rieske 2Fe-2S domain-containing protein [Acidimicrobiia bacterium]
MARHVVAPLSDLPPGQRKVVNVGGRSVVVLNIDDELFALLDRCPHQGASFAGGVLCGLVESDVPGSYQLSRQGEILRCPWHGWEFDVRTGQSWCEPSKIKVRRYEARVETGKRLVEGPYVAETFPVTVEDAYVVVDV